MATPFVQGRLRGTPLSVVITSRCAWCRLRLRLEVSSDLEYRVWCGTDTILLFEPSLDWATFTAPSIVNDY